MSASISYPNFDKGGFPDEKNESDPRQRAAGVNVRRFLRFLQHIGRSTAYSMIKSGKLPSVQVGGRRMIRVDDAEDGAGKSVL